MFHVILYLVEPLIEDCTVFEFIGDILPEIGEIGSVEGSMYGVLFFTMISEECGSEWFICNIAMLRRSKIYLTVGMLRLLLIFMQVGCRHNDLLLVIFYS